jgi:hypothetical protein
MHGFKRLGERVMARTFEPQVVQVHVRVARLNRFTQLGRPTTVPVAAMAQLRLGLGSLVALSTCATKPSPTRKVPCGGVSAASLPCAFRIHFLRRHLVNQLFRPCKSGCGACSQSRRTRHRYRLGSWRRNCAYVHGRLPGQQKGRKVNPCGSICRATPKKAIAPWVCHLEDQRVIVSGVGRCAL